MPSRKTPASWGAKLTPAQRQAARRQRLKAATLANKVLSPEGRAVDKYKSMHDYKLARVDKLKGWFPLYSDEQIRQLALDMPPGEFPDPPPHDVAVRQHQKLLDEMADRKAKQNAWLAEYTAEQERLEPEREARRRAEQQEWENRTGKYRFRGA